MALATELIYTSVRMRQYFDVVMSPVVRLLEKQLETLKSKIDVSATTMILRFDLLTHMIHQAMMVVGGLGASSYVQHLIEQWAEGKNIKVVQVNKNECVEPGICLCRVLTDN